MLKRILMSLVVVAAATGAVGAQAPNKVLRVVPYADLQSLDPIVTTVGIVQSHAMLVYDFLFGRDDDQQPKPQRWSSAGRRAPTSWNGPSPCARVSSSTTARR